MPAAARQEHESGSWPRRMLPSLAERCAKGGPPRVHESARVLLKSLGSLQLLCGHGLRPNGAQYLSPGHRPGSGNPSKRQPCKGAITQLREPVRVPAVATQIQPHAPPRRLWERSRQPARGDGNRGGPYSGPARKRRFARPLAVAVRADVSRNVRGRSSQF